MLTTQQQEELARALDVGFVVIDAWQPSHPLTFVSEGFVHLTGYSKEEALGRSLQMLTGPESDPSVVAAVQRAIQRRKTRTLELLSYRKDGSKFWNLVGMAPMPEADGTVVRMVGVLRNVTHLRQEQMAREREQRMAALGELAGGIAHDFNNLLGVVLGNCSILEDAEHMQPQEKAALRAVKIAAQRGADQVRRLLSLTKAPMLDVRPVDLAAMREELLLMLPSALNADCAVEFSVDEDARWVLGDETQLHGALLNLIQNARNALPAGGQISVLAKREGDTSVQRVLVSVTDNGHGMGPEVSQRMFDPFFTTRKPGQGHGLGLAMVHSYVTSTGGEISVESGVGLGTSVILKLPLAHAAGSGLREAAQARASPRPTGARILLVEDDELLRITISAMLRTLGYAAVAVSSASEALAQLRSDPSFSLLCSDHFLGEAKTGVELCVEARRLRPGLPTLLMSGWTQASPTEVSRAPFIAKPFTVEELGHAIAQASTACMTSRDACA